jgi:site-specific recombinase XerC
VARNPQRNCRRWPNKRLTKAKIKGSPWHCNGHSFASTLVMAEVDLRKVAELIAKAVGRENELITASVISKRMSSRRTAENRAQSMNTNVLQQVAP